MSFYTNHQIIGSKGLKSNRAIKVADSSAKVKVNKPSASKLKAMGYTASQRRIILDSWA